MAMRDAHSFTRYECPNCGVAVDLHHFGTTHHSGVGCVACDTAMEPVDAPEAGDGDE